MEARGAEFAEGKKTGRGRAMRKTRMKKMRTVKEEEEKEKEEEEGKV